MIREDKTGMLYLCATPIGNLEDVTLRVLRILKEADVVAAEDTRQSIKLLNHYEIKTPLVSYHEHNKYEKTPVLVQRMLKVRRLHLSRMPAHRQFRTLVRIWLGRAMKRESRLHLFRDRQQ